ncbi:hypothetical protein [Methylomonas sp. AM2-LC]|uniref:hypothetical protein n=1 Tax=Methylomonas sp. AM2-LC TaxID=3153301 RepID=UPI0032657C6B
MAKKFKNAPTLNDLSQPLAALSLQEYINLHAADVLSPHPFMEGASTLRFWQETFQPVRSGEGKRWINDTLRWPYAERLIYLSREFRQLDTRYQRYILKAAKAHIWWRGDDSQRFQAIVAAHLNYRKLNETERLHYRKRLMQAAQQLLRNG